MTILERAEREAVILEAHTWLRTPFHHEGRVKGAGVDCAQFLIAVYLAVGLVPEINPPAYAFQWALNRSEEKYLEELVKYAREVKYPERAGVVIWKVARTFSHAAIIIEWPQVIHAIVGQGVVTSDVEITADFIGRDRKFFSVWGVK